MNEFTNNIIIGIIGLFSMIALSTLLGYAISRILIKKKYVIAGDAIIHSEEIVDKTQYLQKIINKDKSVKCAWNNSVLIDHHSSGGYLESIPTGRVSKLFLSGRGSWRVTVGNVMTEFGFRSLADKEYSQKL